MIRALAALAGYALWRAWFATAVAEEPAPPPELLEYLGSWEGSDEEWVIVADTQGAAAAEPPRREEAAPDDDDDGDEKDGTND